MIYFRIQLPAYYRRRWRVSRLCSEWEKVVPHRSNHRDVFSVKYSLVKYHSPSRGAGFLKF